MCSRASNCRQRLKLRLTMLTTHKPHIYLAFKCYLELVRIELNGCISYPLMKNNKIREEEKSHYIICNESTKTTRSKSSCQASRCEVIRTGQESPSFL